jgi:hypothetical protein
MTMIDPAPALLSDVISPQWLNSTLGDLAEGERVVEAELVDDYTTVISKVRFKVMVEKLDGERVERRYCVKGMFADGGRGGNLEPECRFYRDLAPTLDLRVPGCVYAGWDPDTGRGLLVMDDLVEQGATFLNSRTEYTVDLTTAVLEQLAILHAGTWGPDNLRRVRWMERNQPSMGQWAPVELLDRQLNDGRADSLPAYLRDPERLKAAMQKVTAPNPVCAVHGDPHSLNVYLDSDGRPGLLDWQLAHINSWAIDVGYHINCVHDIETRRQREDMLLRTYLEKLGEAGVEPPSWEDAQDEYARNLVYGYFLWSLAAKTPRADIVEHAPRLGTAVADHDTYARLGV